MLRLVNVYLVIASVVNLFFFSKALFGSFPEIDASGLFLSLIIIASVAYCLYSNTLLLLRKKEHRFTHLLRYNLWYNIFQIPGFSVLGFVYIFSAGMEVVPYIINNGDLNIGCRFDLFNVKGSCYYDPGEITSFIGFNLIPLGISVFLNSTIQKLSRFRKNEE